jgi:hypothetical protein
MDVLEVATKAHATLHAWRWGTPYDRETDCVFASARSKGKTPRFGGRCWWDYLRPALVERPERVVKLEVLNAFDGTQPGLTSLKPQAVRSPDGRLWFVNGQILQILDPDHLSRNEIPPPVHSVPARAQSTHASSAEINEAHSR